MNIFFSTILSLFCWSKISFLKYNNIYIGSTEKRQFNIVVILTTSFFCIYFQISFHIFLYYIICIFCSNCLFFFEKIVCIFFNIFWTYRIVCFFFCYNLFLFSTYIIFFRNFFIILINFFVKYHNIYIDLFSFDMNPIGMRFRGSWILKWNSSASEPNLNLSQSFFFCFRKKKIIRWICVYHM